MSTPTDDTLRAAAERLRRMQRGDGLQVVYSDLASTWGHETNLWLIDKSKLADTYLAEHDPTPVTPEWLRSVGFENGGAMSGLVLTHEQDGLVTKITLHHRFGWKLSSGTTQENLTSSSTIQLHAPPKTRGDVRLLAKALGVDLKE